MKNLNFKISQKIYEELDCIRESLGFSTLTGTFTFLVKKHCVENKLQSVLEHLPPPEVKSPMLERRDIPEKKYFEMMECGKYYGTDALMELFQFEDVNDCFMIIFTLEFEKYIKHERYGYIRL